MPGGKIFLSYRRDDSAGHAGRLYDRLNARFPGRIFMDVSGIAPGVDFVEEIERAVGSCQVLIVLIGKDWLDIKDAAGRRRLDTADDFVRLEVATGLGRKIRVIPTLVRDAHMPSAEALPPDLAALARRNAIEINDHDFDHDVERLIQTLETELGEQSRQPLTPTDEDERKAKHFARLQEQAQAAMGVEDWMTAIQSLQAALSLNPNDAETAAQLRRAHEQQKLSALFSRCQKLYESGDKQGALACFRQVRVAGGNYKNVNSLITMMQTESAPLQPLPPTPAPSRWGFGLLAGVIAAVVVGVVGLSLLLVLLNSSAEPQPEPSNQNASNQSFASP
ncbi:MAG: toll/interleukin-1 receptor domain-containing protein, partial [Acidobacteria bacterium]|nr:toll/interleukin-1 receptor domain-containing protein [Acidobacteriota bacterium]